MGKWGRLSSPTFHSRGQSSNEPRREGETSLGCKVECWSDKARLRWAPWEYMGLTYTRNLSRDAPRGREQKSKCRSNLRQLIDQSDWTWTQKEDGCSLVTTNWSVTTKVKEGKRYLEDHNETREPLKDNGDLTCKYEEVKRWSWIIEKVRRGTILQVQIKR